MRSENWGELMYLSRVFLDVNDRRTMKALGSPSIIHGALESSFTGGRPHCLWRIDDLNGKLCILILSEVKPDLTDFCRQFSSGTDAETKNYDGLLDRIVKNSRWRFRLTANPTRSLNGKGQRGKKIAHSTVEHQKRWLTEKAAANGFNIGEDDFDVVQSKWHRFYKSGDRYVTFLSVTYEGILEVTDETLFRQALVNGIGRGKAYGQGMLTVMRI